MQFPMLLRDGGTRMASVAPLAAASSAVLAALRGRTGRIALGPRAHGNTLVGHFDIIGVDSDQQGQLVLHHQGLPGGFATTAAELETLSAIMRDPRDVSAGPGEDADTTFEAVAKAVAAELQRPATREPTSGHGGALTAFAYACIDAARDQKGMEQLLRASDYLLRTRAAVAESFPYHVGGDKGVRQMFCTDAHILKTFGPSVRHRAKVLCAAGVGTCVGTAKSDGDWLVYWHTNGASAATLWPAPHCLPTVLVGESALVTSGPTARCTHLTEPEDVGRYLHLATPSGFDTSQWLLKGLFGTEAGARLSGPGGVEVIGVGRHPLYPTEALELFVKDPATNTIIPHSLTQ